MIGVSRASSTRSYQLLATTTITSTGSQTYTVPVRMVYAEVELWGAGGGGGGGGAYTDARIDGGLGANGKVIVKAYG
jgi:hypothetical protein